MGPEGGSVKTGNPQRRMHIPRAPTKEEAALGWFGDLVDRHLAVAIDVGGVIVPGADASDLSSPGKEDNSADEPTAAAGPAGAAAGARAGDGPATGSRSGRRAPAEAPARSAAHAVGQLTAELRRRFGDWSGNGITEGEFEELASFYPDVRVTASSSRFAYLGLSATPFPALGVGFRFVFELPHPRFVTDLAPPPKAGVADLIEQELARSGKARPRLLRPVLQRLRERMVPSVRAWARWEDGPAHGAQVISHHRQPDLSICACKPEDWKRGRDLLVDYVGMAVCWGARIQYEQHARRYPGVQHYLEWVRRERDRVEEFCGCGARKRYRDCHRGGDLKLSAAELQRMELDNRRAYYEELARERRPVRPPADAWD